MALSIPHKKLNSSVIKSAGYIATHGGILEVLFQSGIMWRYKNIPPVVYQHLISVDSPGSYYNAIIKGRYIGKPVAKRGRDVI